ncbi:enoyl-CoA hydratase/isomerase family protein [Rhodococcoides fascians]|uniref:enoyl-CoA hydratase/isomerase family protein n=1 Tax=Rhodococcoides fascians TaxID=1828 RepID=UPI00050BDD7B|nr:enoyl-CoA hydratase/isomerase family protein [Rhodococcus fascians]
MGPALLIDDSLDGRIVVRLNRTDTRNAIDLDMVRELHELCSELESRPRIAIFSGEGPAFASGADIEQLRARRRDDALAGINSRIFDRIHDLPMPTIALLHGYALGGGAELAYACDFRIGATDLRIGNPEVGLGIAAAAGAGWRLRDLVGLPLAKDMLLTGKLLNAQSALASGLLNHVVEPAMLLDAGHELADRISAQSPTAVRLTKTILAAPRAAHPIVDELAQAILFETPEKAELMDAFLSARRRTS